MSLRCDCGDSECSSCGTAQGTRIDYPRRRFCDVNSCGGLATTAYRDTGEFYCEEHRHAGDGAGIQRCERDGFVHDITTPDRMQD